MEEHRELARRAEAAGFDLLMAGQHFVADELRYFQPIPLLAHLSGLVPSMRVGTGILLLPLLHPVEVAEQMATLDVVSGGRAVFGVGLGYVGPEFEAFGVEPSRRFARFDDCIEIVRRLWEGGPVEYQGRELSVSAPPSAVVPVQRPHPPIWVAGQTPNAVRRAARVGDAWYGPPYLTHAQLRELSALHRVERERLGHPPSTAVPVRREVYLADTVAEAATRVGPHVGRRHATYAKWGLEHATVRAEERLEDMFILGPPERCVNDLRQWHEELGMTDFVLRVQWPGMDFAESVEQLQRFGAEVLPAFRPA
jgi:alkanesulfonate monooxygenase SsuD/methylene tetrahydromethanopterin reductase-like flavin-dependent oxidoreductase (luciferase family)